MEPCGRGIAMSAARDVWAGLDRRDNGGGVSGEDRDGRGPRRCQWEGGVRGRAAD